MTARARSEDSHDPGHGDEHGADRRATGHSDGGGSPRAPKDLQRRWQGVVDQAIDRMRFLGQVIDRAACAHPQDGGGDASPRRRCAQFSADEHALLAAWDASNAAIEPSPSFIQQVREACGADASAGERAEIDDLDLGALDGEMTAEDELDEAVLRAHPCFASDADEFRAIIEQEQDYLVRVARRLCGARDTADDLVQDALMRGWSSYRQFKPGTNVRAWLGTILTRLFLDQLKHDKVVRKAEPELQIVVVERDDGGDKISDAALWEAVRKLEPDLRDVLERAYVKGMRYREIASELKIPIGTIGTRLMRARERLRALLTDASEDSTATTGSQRRDPEHELCD